MSGSDLEEIGSKAREGVDAQTGEGKPQDIEQCNVERRENGHNGHASGKQKKRQDGDR